MDDDPLMTLLAWRQEAVALGEPEPDAMSLATSTADGHPSVRIVLFRGVDDGRIRFFTNYQSRKGEELLANPVAALCFFWPRLGIGRQIRVEGTIEKVSDAASDAYFAERPRGHQLGAWASDQSRPTPGIAELTAKFDAQEARYRGQPVPRPPHWGGYGLRPERIEHWVGRDNRLHERRLYVREGSAWALRLLQP